MHLLPFMLSAVVSGMPIDTSFAAHARLLAPPLLGLAYTWGATVMLRGYASKASALGAFREVRPRVLWLASLTGMHGMTWCVAALALLGAPLHAAAAFLHALSGTLLIHWIGVAIPIWPFIARDRLRHPATSFTRPSR